MNKVELSGRLARDPEVRHTQTGKAIATFTLAVERKYKQDGQPKADFVPIVVWDKQGEACGNNLLKGSLIEVVGHIQIRSYEKDGSKHYVTEVIAEEVGFLARPHTGAQTATQEGTQGESIPDEEIPF